MAEAIPKFKVRKKKLGSYPFVSTVFSITLALLVTGVFGILLIYSKELERIVRENVRIQVYLKSNVNEAQRLQIAKNLSAQHFIPKDKKESNIRFESKEQAAERFIKDTGEDFLQFLGENPLRDSFVVLIDPEYQTKERLSKIKTDVEQINGVFQVDYPESTISSVNENMATIGLVLIGAATLLLIAVVVLINNTLRLALFSQRFLIRSMQLVGAKSWFIQRPFLFRAAIHGLAAGLLACGVIAGLVYFANKNIEALQLIQNKSRMTTLLGSLILMGIFVAVLSTYRAVNKYLKLSLDELY
ncbi:MAG TPA: permease-like cell division protein FtsX [Cyclobacteriaceae bacterium]|nr:permease-like cell division protein FtsX [Cyclobacteriaceae bacterium]